MPSFQQSKTDKPSFHDSCTLLHQQMCHFSSLLSPIPSQQEENAAQISSLQLSLDLTQNQLKELSTNKDKAIQQCRKIKKWFWRLVTERCTLQHARKVLEDQSYDLDNVILEHGNFDADQNTENTDNNTNNNNNDAEPNKNIEELNLKISCRDDQIKELTEQLQNVAKSNISDNHSSISQEQHEKLTAELASSKSTLKQNEFTIESLTNQCAIEKANIIHYQKSLEELQSKHDKKVQELLDLISHDKNNTDNITKITELQHKYAQVLEELKQLDSLRYTLKETRKLNDYHQHKMEEYKSKYISLTQNKKDNSKKMSSTTDSTNENDNQHHSNDQHNKVSYDKMKADFRRVRKELAAANLSKENYKAKHEKLDKERDTLLKTNTRLLKQNSEKEEVNTKSLSTILHLKHILELKEKEKEQLDICKKSAEQLSLSARMMIKGKQRIGEELQTSKTKMEEEQRTLQEQNNTLQKQNDDNVTRIVSLQSTIDNHQSQITSLQNQYQTTHDKLLQIQKEKFNLMEKMSISDNNSTTNNESSSSSTAAASSSNFSVNQLNTQINVLKGRLACPVCNYRDKACILARCRHMFCRQCIDENIKNRSRKCPACGQKFDTKDVGDIWL